MQPLASIEDLKERLDRELDERELKMADAALVDASELARFHGRDWTDPAATPRLVKTLILRACMRYMHNPEGYVISRAGDETLTFSDRVGSEQYGTVYFTADERRLLAELGGRTGTLSTAGASAWGTVEDWERHTGDCRPGRHSKLGLRPVDYGGDPFPLYVGDGPW